MAATGGPGRRAGADILVVEGVMGLFDGAADGQPEASTASIARLLDAPVVLVVDASAMSGSVAALVHGYCTFDPSVRIAGVVLNRVGGPGHENLLREALHPLGVPVLGALRRDDSSPGETATSGWFRWSKRGRDESIDRASGRGDRGLARPRGHGGDRPIGAPREVDLPLHRVRVGHARWPSPPGRPSASSTRTTWKPSKRPGRNCCRFDPRHDPGLPDGSSGDVRRRRFSRGLRGGTLGQPATPTRPAGQGEERAGHLGGMRRTVVAGPIPRRASTRRARPGRGHHDRSSHPRVPNRRTPGGLPLGRRPGTRLRGHEFHYSSLSPSGSALTLRSRAGESSAGFASPRLFASYLHLHLGSDPRRAERFVSTASTHPVPVVAGDPPDDRAGTSIDIDVVGSGSRDREHLPALPSQEVGVEHPPLPRPSGRPDLGDRLTTFADRPRDQDLVVGAEKGAPVDGEVVIECPERALRVEHDDDIGRSLRPAVAQLAPRGDRQRPADLGEGDPVSSGQGLNGADAWNDLDASKSNVPRVRTASRILNVLS